MDVVKAALFRAKFLFLRSTRQTSLSLSACQFARDCSLFGELGILEISGENRSIPVSGPFLWASRQSFVSDLIIGLALRSSRTTGTMTVALVVSARYSNQN